MKISEIIQLEKDNKFIILHKEGTFWRAYEYSAFCFVTLINNYNVLHKYFKNVGQSVVYVGFPDSYLETIARLCKQKQYRLQTVNEKQIIIKGITKQMGFEQWKSEIIEQYKNKVVDIKSVILKKIMDYPLATKTPLEAQQFLFSLQNEINGTI